MNIIRIVNEWASALFTKRVLLPCLFGVKRYLQLFCHKWHKMHKLTVFRSNVSAVYRPLLIFTMHWQCLIQRIYQNSFDFLCFHAVQQNPKLHMRNNRVCMRPVSRVCACVSCTEAKFKENENKKKKNWKPTETQISILPHHAMLHHVIRIVCLRLNRIHFQCFYYKNNNNGNNDEWPKHACENGIQSVHTISSR